jgi:serine/threonine-protein phosphatase 2A regulatory subunit B''
MINEAFSAGNELKKQELVTLTTELCGLPKIFNQLLFNRIDTGKIGKVAKSQFQRYYTNELQKEDTTRRLFKLIAKPKAKYLEKEDFMPLIKVLLETHPGLEFLKATPEFQDKYGNANLCKGSRYSHIQDLLYGRYK